jgi:acyl carrier protein
MVLQSGRDRLCRVANRDRIRTFILDHVSEPDLADDVDIFAQGLVTSMFVVQLVAFVEREFDVAVTGGDLDLAHFRSISAVDGLVSRLASA